MDVRICDLHMHIVPGIDDGSRSLDESIEMLKLSAEQGVTDVFCTSHNGYSIEDGERYIEAFEKLKLTASEINIRLHKGCEVLCAGEYIDDIVYGLDIGAFSTLGDTKYVLTELYSDTRPSEALQIINTLKKNGYNPIIAHMERNYNITGIMVNTLIQSGAMIQINAHSLFDYDNGIRARARELLDRRYVHFIGSDAHRIDHRPPSIAEGAKYIIDNTDIEYASKILSGNSRDLLINYGSICKKSGE